MVVRLDDVIAAVGLRPEDADLRVLGRRATTEPDEPVQQTMKL
jgi:hypothetical protein